MTQSMVEKAKLAIREADILSVARDCPHLSIGKIRELADECEEDYEDMARAAIEAVLDSLTPVEATAILDSYGIEYAIFTDNGGDE